MNAPGRRYHAGESLEDFCRACKTDRMHTIIVTDQDSAPLRVSCGFCHSEHNYRGGPRLRAPSASPGQAARSNEDLPRRGTERGNVDPSHRNIVAARAEGAQAEPFPLVSDRERIAPMTAGADVDLEMLLRRIIREETGLTPVAPAEKWRGGTLILRPGTPGLQDKTWPIETFFHKVVMLRNRLRTLEQQVNAADLPDDAKVKLQGYISGCYGSLTSFNVLFASEEDQFKGSGGD
jgi:hypothetical protein